MWVRFVNLDQLAAGAVIAALPTIVVYLALRGLLAGSSQGIREYYSVLVSPLRIALHTVHDFGIHFMEV